MINRFRVGATISLFAVAAAVYAATAVRFGPEVNVSRTPTPTEKAKVVRLAYLHDGIFKKVWLFTYGDGPIGRQNVYARHSFDEGATWSVPVLLSRDAADAATGGQSITAKGPLIFEADNEKPTIFAPPVTSGPLVVITWNGAYCPQNPAAANNAGSYDNPLQGVSDFNGDGTLDRPYHCLWVATTTDPMLAAWDVHQLTNGERDVINEVISGSSTGSAFAMAWQEDPAGLQPGEGEGRGDGGMGSHVTGGTNIWYTHAPNPNGVTLRSNIAQLSNNNALGTGQPGASRPNLQISGTTAVLAYEETACPGGSTGKCIVYHSFPYTAHDANAPGTLVSDVTKNARRVRFFLQGAAAAGTSSLRTVLLWRETPFVTPAAPSDIIVRRGLVNAAERPGSTGYLPGDILADTPQNLTDVARFGGNANAHRAIVRGSFVGIAYDLTPNMDAANPEKTAVPTANYNLIFTRSTANGEVGSWSPALSLSRIDSPSFTVVEPRLVPTPATIVNPLTGTPDAGDTQNPNVLYASFATESNELVGRSGRVSVARSIDQGATFERFVPVSSVATGQSEAQLRPGPDGASTMVLWMGEQTTGDPGSKDAMFAIANAIQLPDLKVLAADASFPAFSQFTVTLTVLNHGTGQASKVALTGTLPDGLTLVGIGDPSICTIKGTKFACAIPSIAAGAGRAISLTVTGGTEGKYTVNGGVTSEEPDAEVSDNPLAFTLSVTPPLSALPPLPTPPPIQPPIQPPTLPPVTTPPVTVTPAPIPQASGGGGGCTAASSDASFDPILALLVGLGFVGPGLRRTNGRSRSPGCAEPIALRSIKAEGRCATTLKKQVMCAE
jgi:hypothetical protein